ncbi:ABC transporter permease [Acidianus manzaensis]|uniref:ABC transmembrane type-1 domain-containing protein n=1 Tax=Acidianus manzaensis TaxID=282676 RepID=A0A1W6JZ16_9CREN|nr:ABC transporter permease [Acidianus manzaensis]ARM75475.1 hypothetical protein B6F84_05140 [Acidianus manzaensis]
MSLLSYALKRLAERIILLVVFTIFMWFLVLGFEQIIGINPATVFVSPGEFLHAKNPLLAYHIALHEVEKDLGLNYPLYSQFVIYLEHMFTLNLGTCIAGHFAGESISKILIDGFPYTALLTIPPLVFQTILAIYLGSIAAIKKNTKTDTFISNYMIIQYNIPVFAITIIFWVIFAVIYKVYPLSDLPYLSHLNNILLDLKIFSIPWIIQTLVYGFPTRGILMRNSMAENLESDFIRYERLAGLREKILRTDARRVSIIPVVVRTAIDVAFVLSGDLFIEEYFGIPGWGYILYQSAISDEIVLILGSTFLLTLYALILLYFVDIFEAIIDPRARKSVK